jgi:hypothetical protein
MLIQDDDYAKRPSRNKSENGINFLSGMKMTIKVR